MKSPDFFVFGVERSGTTLLSFLLGSQPGIFVLNDSFIYDMFIKSQAVKVGSGMLQLYRWVGKRIRPFSKLVRSIRKEPYLLRSVQNLQADTVITYKEARRFHDLLGAGLGSLRSEQTSPTGESWIAVYRTHLDLGQIAEHSGSIALVDLLNGTYDQIAKAYANNDTVIYGEKTPIHTYYAEWIVPFYQTRKIILILRNPITNIASLYKRNYQDLNLAIRIYQRYIPNLLWISKLPVVHVIKYEDLILNPKATLRDAVNYLDKNLVFDATLPLIPYIKGEYVGNLIDKSRDNALMNLLNTAQKEKVLKECQPIFQQFYPSEIGETV